MSSRSRRRGSVAACSLLALAVALGLSACGSSIAASSSAEGGLVTTTPGGTEPVETVTWDLPYGEPATLDWLESAAFSENTVLSNLCESLIHLTPELGYAPGLAESWRSPDPTTWIYNLRPDLRFSDGHPVTVQDVVYSLDRNRDPENGSFWEPWFENVASIKATGPEQITVRLTHPDVLFNQFLATAAGVVGEQSYVEEQGKKYGTSEGGVMCVGPYQLSSWIPGREIRLVADPYYWNAEKAPQAKNIEFDFLTEGRTVTDALLSGEIDGTYESPLDSWPILASADIGKAYAGLSTAFSSVEFTEKEGPDQDVDFRRALQLAIDRPAIARTIFHGAGVPIKSTFSPATWGYARKVFARGYAKLPSLKMDLPRAERLAEKIPALRPVTMLSNSSDVASKQLGVYIQSQAKKIGIDIKLEELPAAQFIAASFDRKQANQYDMVLSNTGYIDIAEPLEYAELAMTTNGAFNFSGYENTSVNRWIEQARETTDPVARAKLLVKVDEQAYGKDFFEIPIVNPAERLFMNSSISGAVASLTPLLYAPWAQDLGGVR